MVDTLHMVHTIESYPQILLTGPAQGASVPKWLQPFDAQIVRVHDFKRSRRLPELTVVRAGALDSIFKEKTFLHVLSRSFDSTPAPAKIVFLLREQKAAESSLTSLVQLFEHFSRPADLEVAMGADAAEHAVEEAIAKLWAIRNRLVHGTTPDDPLGTVKEILAATRDLRSPEGRLTAERVAEVFGLSVSELASALGRNRQSVFKTPDSEALQEPLRAFERTARLRALLSDRDFQDWLNLGNQQLEKRSPLDLIREGRASVVADLAEDMLTGNPT